MEYVWLVVALAVSGCLGVARLGRTARQGSIVDLDAALETRIQARTQTLSRALDAAEDQVGRLAAASQSKSDILTGLSYEVRTSLNAVIGFSDLMRMNVAAEPLTRRQAQAVEQIAASGQHLLALIETVLDLAGIEAGQRPMSIERIDPQLVVRQVCDSLRTQAEAAGVTLRNPPPTAGFGVLADRTRLRQVLITLVSNAITYNRPGGSVLLEIRQSMDGVALSVHDTGVGIHEDRVAALFQPFSQLGRETDDRAGTGMGLAVSYRLAQAMNGRLDVVSRVGEGSSFTLHLPLAPAVTLPVLASPIPIGTLGEATLLYVEDNPSNIALMRHVVTALGPIRLHVAENGHEGLALARVLRPDVIVLDINLPGLTGFELKTRLDADPLTRGIPVLALSASAMPGDVRRGREAGFRDYLTKPLDIPAFAAALSRVLTPDAETERPRAA